MGSNVPNIKGSYHIGEPWPKIKAVACIITTNDSEPVVTWKPDICIQSELHVILMQSEQGFFAADAE